MITNIKKEWLRRRAAAAAGEEAGFTLIELMVVVLIIAILMAIAIPTFLGAKGTAQDRSAQENARNGLTNADTIFASTQVWTGVTIAALSSADPALTFAAASGTVGQVGTATGTANGWGDAVYSANNKCWMIYQPAVGATIFGEHIEAACVAADVPAAAPAITAPTANPAWLNSGFPTN